MTQLALPFRRSADPVFAELERTALKSALRHGQWLTAAQLAVMLDWSDRKVRSVASDCDGVVSFPGSKGYKLLASCTLEEIQHASRALRSQADDMIARSVRIDRAYHSKAFSA